MNELRIHTEHVFPPIPDRSHDWAAYDDDTYCGCGECHCLTGYGPTEAAAIADLMDQLDEEKQGSVL